MSRSKRPHAVTDHWLRMAEFSRWELASGGPDPQIDMIRLMAREGEGSLSREEFMWRVMMYVAVYNVPFAEVMWREMPWASVSDTPTSCIPWVNDVFEKKTLTTRLERRCVRRSDWMLEYLGGAHRLVGEHEEIFRKINKFEDPREVYEAAWTYLLSFPRVGRYVAIKLIELLRREGILRAETPDIRPRGAWSPRHTLGVLWEADGLMNRDDSPAALAAATRCCHDTIARLGDEYDVGIDMFQLQVLLCEYRESYESRKQYPGRSLDSELGYVRKAEAQWGHESGIWAARQTLFPHRHLGELATEPWDGPRKDVAEVLALHDYTWSDLVYDYRATNDFSAPARRAEVPA